MSHTHAKRNQQAPPSLQTPEHVPEQGPSLDALRAGLAQPTAEQLGHRVDLPDAMRAKMEVSFGADLSSVKLYESEAVADAGAQAVTQGSNIAFAPGMLDFSSYGGQALLGHELSHVVSQSRGEVTGSGFLNDHALEAQADREGAMAAAGQQIAIPVAAMSSVTAAPSAGPMQAKKKPKAQKEAEEEAEWEDLHQKAKLDSGTASDMESKGSSLLDPAEYRRYEKLNVNHWKRLKKQMSNAEFYDMIEEQSRSNTGNVPKFAQSWFSKHQDKNSRWSGKKGWGSPEELTARQAQRFMLLQQEAEDRRNRDRNNEFEDFFI